MFEGLLQEQGFFWKDKGFYRIGNKILIGVTLYPGSSGAFYSLRWFCFPFCWKLGVDQMKAHGNEQIEPFLAIDPSVDFRKFSEEPFEKQLEIMHRVFFRDIFSKLNDVCDVAGCLNYQNWRLDKYEGGRQKEYLEIPKAWECIFLRRYEDAVSYLKAYLNKAKSFPENAPSRLQEASKEANYLLGLIERQDLVELDRMIKERVLSSEMSCKEYFGERQCSNATF